MTRKMTDLLNDTVSAWTVFIVDDTPDNLTVAKTVMEYYGAKVHTASGGVEALNMLETLQPTLILLDIRMPDMDGWAVFHAIRQNPKTAHIPVIALLYPQTLGYFYICGRCGELCAPSIPACQSIGISRQSRPTSQVASPGG